MRIGQGYDVHRLVEGRKLILGGVEVANDKGLLGHSDADVLTHAVIDAILGAAKLGNIGKMFPDDDESYKNANSLELLQRACREADRIGYKIINIDSTIVAQKPKLIDYIEGMERNISSVCGIPIQRVSVKAKTEEGLGFTGSQRGISAYAVCLISDGTGRENWI